MALRQICSGIGMVALGYSLCLVVATDAYGQLNPGGGGVLRSPRPSDHVGRFSTGVSTNAARNVRRRLQQLQQRNRTAGTNVGHVNPLAGRSRQPNLGPVESGTGSFTNIRGGSSRSRRYGRNLAGIGSYSDGMPLESYYQRSSVLDRLVDGYSIRSIPGVAVGEVGLTKPSRPLPTVYGDKDTILKDRTDLSVTSYLLSGRAQLRKRDFASARSSFRMARTISPNAPWPRVGLIQIEILVSNYRTAAAMLRDLATRAPEVFSSSFDIRAWHETPEAYDEALADFKAQIRDSTKAGEMARVLMAYVAWTNGDRQRAINQIRMASDESPHETAWHNMLRALESPADPKPADSGQTTAATSGGLPPL